MKTSLGYYKILITKNLIMYTLVLVIKKEMQIQDHIKKGIYDVLRESQTEFVDE